MIFTFSETYFEAIGKNGTCERVAIKLQPSKFILALWEA
jgi:hypothetical protein